MTRVVVITGASDGIGAEMARQLAAKEGAGLALVLAARNAAQLDAVNLRVAEHYVDAFGKLAKTNNSIIVPADLGDMSGLIASALQIVKAQR